MSIKYCQKLIRFESVNSDQWCERKGFEMQNLILMINWLPEIFHSHDLERFDIEFEFFDTLCQQTTSTQLADMQTFPLPDVM